MAEKGNFTVVRNMAYSAKSIGIRERHNERKNETYYNSDIVPERAHLNVHYRQCLSPDGTPETYERTFNRLLDEGVIVKRGLKPDAKMFDEFVFDVNTAYFDERGGYGYAKDFYEAAYRLAVQEAGGEEYILSAVMHADERNSMLSEKLGRDVWHYHLHVVYVPVVEKEVLWSKRCKDPALVGTLKEVIPQISHSKKWPRIRGGDGKWLNSYSLLQDRFFDGMREMGFEDFERGQFGSTAKHRDTETFKLQQDQKRIAELDAEIKRKEKTAADLGRTITVREKAKATVEEIDKMGTPTMLGDKFTVTGGEMKKLKILAKRSVTTDDKVRDANRRRDAAEKLCADAIAERDELKKQAAAGKPSVIGNLTVYQKLLAAFQRAPKRLLQIVEDILKQPPERDERQITKPKNREELR